MSHPKFILVSDPARPLAGTFVYGMVGQHKELVHGYVKVHGGGWYLKDDAKKTTASHGSSRTTLSSLRPTGASPVTSWI